MIYTGELLRDCVMSGTPKGIQLFGIMEKGQHVPDVSNFHQNTCLESEQLIVKHKWLKFHLKPGL